MRAPSPGRFECSIEPPRLHILRRAAEQARHFARVRSQRKRWSKPLVQVIGHARVRVQSVGIQNDRKVRAATIVRMNSCVSFCIESPGPIAMTTFPAHDFREAAIVKITKACRTGFGRGQRRGHQFGNSRGHDRQNVPRSRDGYESRAGPQRASPGQNRGAGFPERPGDNQRVAVRSFVRVGVSGERQRAKFPGLDPMDFQMGIGFQQLRRGPNAPYHEHAASIRAR